MKKKKRARPRKKSFDVEDLLEKMYEPLKDVLGLSSLGIDETTSRAIAKEVLEAITQGLSTKPDLESVLKRIKRYAGAVNELIASKLLELVKEPNPAVLEFVVYNGGRSIIGEIPRLYSIAKRLGREDLISYMRYLWAKLGVRSPVRCPKCQFDSIMPDYSCYVCGHVVSEKYVRESLGFEEKFKAFMSESSAAELRLAIERGFVFVGEDGVYGPSYKPKSPKMLFQVYLKREELAAIAEEVESRELQL